MSAGTEQRKLAAIMFTKVSRERTHDWSSHNTSEVLFRLSANTDPQRDRLFPKARVDMLDRTGT